MKKKFTFEKKLYNRVVLPMAYGLFSAAAPFHRKLRETLRGRRGVLNRWKAGSERLDGRPVWFHVSSVGEFEQARPVISMLGRDYPNIPVAISITSPSGMSYAVRKEDLDSGGNIKFIDYLPLDFAANARFCLAALNPRLLVFVKFDLWPNLIWEAASMNIPSVLIDATLSGNSYRFTSIGRRFYRAVYPYLKRILAISETDADRFHSCTPEHTGISVTGDTRFDRVMERKSRNGNNGLEIDKDNRLVVIAGSTWPRDEAHLLGPLARLGRAMGRELLVVIAPHEPTPDRVNELMTWARMNDMTPATLSHREALANANGKAQVLVIDTVGVLAEAYHLGDVAYIGGGFSTGVHSVIEPAIMGIPVLFGPSHENSFEASQLLRRDAAVEVRNERDMYDTLSSVLEDKDRRRRMGESAREYVESQLGATNRCMVAINEYL